ncbi:MAG TPA: nucleotidyl transferase AbiEii/AbiGii toxin family protein [Chryseolinea sp.]
MIDNHSFSAEWLTEKRKTHAKADPSIMEKVIYALCLLQQLKKSGLTFIFKGGTSLLLLLPDPARFSVDVDIVVSPDLSREAIGEFLNKVKDEGIFVDMELDEKRSYNGRIPKAHYRFVYQSQYSGKPQEVLLDILFEKNQYPVCVERAIACEWIRLQANALFVTTPDVNSLAGDKLTAFAPNTIGVPYGAEKEREIIKQLFDVGMLYPLIDNIETVKVSYKSIAAIEIAYRALPELTHEDVLNDTIATALILARRESQENASDGARFSELMLGIKQFIYFVYNGRFRIDDAILASAKAALLAAAIKTDFQGTLPVFDPSAENGSYGIHHPEYSFLNKKLKHIRGGALFYWSEIVKLLYPYKI